MLVGFINPICVKSVVQQGSFQESLYSIFIYTHIVKELGSTSESMFHFLTKVK